DADRAKLGRKGLKLPIQPPRGQVQVRVAPVVSFMIWMDLRKSRASLVPSGETPIPARSVARIFPGTVSLVRWAVHVAGAKVSRKKATCVVLSRFWARAPACPEATFHQRWAASTNVRSSAAPLTKLKTL